MVIRIEDKPTPEETEAAKQALKTIGEKLEAADLILLAKLAKQPLKREIALAKLREHIS